MSAIWGIWRRDGNPRVGEDLAAQARVLSAYGEDRLGQWTSGAVGLGCALKRTLPEDDFDHQPVKLADGSVLVADVRLDDRAGLCGELGVTGSGLADSELLGSAWLRWGEQSLDRLVGEFAFAVWTPAARRLYCARDAAGRRMLYYALAGPLVAFSSAARGLHALGIERRLDEEMLAGRLARLRMGDERTLFAQIGRVSPGGLLTVSQESVRRRRYWQIDCRRRIEYASDEQYVEAFTSVFEAAVRSRLRSRRGLGVMLSGGFDSGAVAAMASALGAQDLTAFTSVPALGFDGRVAAARFGDESAHAAEVARMAGLKHVLVRPLDCCLIDMLGPLRAWTESPGTHLCLAPDSQAMSDTMQAAGLGVMLTGSGGNLTISYHGLTLLPALLGSLRWLAWWQEARGLIARAHFGWPGVLAASLGHRLPGWLWATLQARRQAMRGAPQSRPLLNPEWYRSGALSRLAASLGCDRSGRPPGDGPQSRMGHLFKQDLGELAAGRLAATGLDGRDPTVDRRVIEFCLAVPERQYLRRGRTKYLLRRAMAGRMPAKVLDEWRKGLSGPDWYLRVAPYQRRFSDAVERIAASAAARRVVDVEQMRTLVARWPEDWTRPEVETDYRMGLCRAIQMGDFARWVEEGE